MRLLRENPLVHQTVSNRQGQREVPVAVSRGIVIFRQSAPQVALEILAQTFG
jgi:hypothetical protein